MAKPEDVYNSVPSAAPQVGSPENSLNVRATPASFGAQVGGALEQAGQKAEAGNQELFNTALQRQGMLNEAAATDISTGSVIQRDNINAKYKTLEGFDAVGAREQTIAALVQVRQDALAKISNPAVRRAYDMLDHRQEAFSINEANTWGVTQGHQAAVNSADSSVKLSVAQSSLPSIAMNDARFTDSLANIKFNTARKVSLLGFGSNMTQDPKTGDVTFDSSSHGQSASAVYQQELNTNLGQAWDNKLKQEASANPLHAQDVLNKYKDKIPPAVAADWSYKLRGAVDAADTANFANGQLAQSEADYYKNLIPDSGPVTAAPSWLHSAMQTQESNNNPNAVSPKGAIGLMQVMPGTLSNPGYGVRPANITFDMTADQKTAEYKRVGDDYLNALYTKYHGNPTNTLVAYNWGPDKTDKWVKQGADFQQLPPETQVYLSKILPKGMGATGGSLNQVDFYRQNEPQILGNTFDQAMHKYGDITLANQAVSHVEQKINLIKQQAEDQIKVQRDQLADKITGAGGQPTITSMSQLEGPGADPQLKTQWLDYKGRDWYGSNALQNLIASQNKGISKTYGTDFYNQYQNVLTGKTTNADDLGPYMKVTGSSPDSAAVTNTGYSFFKNKIDQMNDPKTGAANKAFASAESKFLSTMHDEATGANIFKDIQSPQLNSNFNNKLPGLIQQIDEAKAAGKSQGDLFNPDSKDYAGKLFQLPKPSDIVAEHYKEVMGRIGIPDVKGQGGTEQLIKTLDDTSVTKDQKRQTLESAWSQGKGFINSNQAIGLGKKYNLYNFGSSSIVGPSVPLPSDH